ncbi:uncharacterized protein RHOBADRAFT_56004 [Rhodotorula graminis WP1]|uniref:Right handed beta helix domain-containing protein n=1 Tax=Rhodotorula graminis (strain WP1) TaxID=578459 RepID=A0A0P9ES62_RHOGW|nr:uncharacterized protein RHOBADRAFT_56004 [Rhodotorula graminis WP1]KPV72174.1 hypothetical protein RHOBADRAFT_56004 [Rhodotorula graminis WP1]
MPPRPRVRHALALSALLLGTALAAGPQHHLAPTTCLETATALEVNELLRSRGEGAAIILCPYAHVTIDSHGPPITFTAPRQSIFTKGFPDDHSRATLVIEDATRHVSGDTTTAIAANCAACRGVQIRNIHVDGGREHLGALEGGDALIVVGGDAGGQTVRRVDAWGARGFAVVHAAEGDKGSCRDVVVTENVVQSAGDAPYDAFLESELARLREGPPAFLGQERPGTWTDGISIACARSIVSDNTVRDVSGVGIALRGAPATTVFQNTVVARDRDMLVGISIVANPAHREAASELGGVFIRGNRVHAASAMIRIGISTGSGPWATDELEGDHEIPFASEIVRNRLSSYHGYLGYAIALSDARALVVKDNAVSASIWGMSTSSCYSRPAYIPPTPLLRDPRSVIGSLQPGFTNSHFGFLLCVGPGSASSSFEVSRHQINDQHAKAFHEALNAAEQAIVADDGRLSSSSGTSRRKVAHARPATIPLGELHPHPNGAHVGVVEAPHGRAPHEGRAVELSRALAARKAHAHKRLVRPAPAPVQKKQRADAAGPSAAERERAAAEEVVRGGAGGMQRKRLRAPRPLRRAAAGSMHRGDESVF